MLDLVAALVPILAGVALVTVVAWRRSWHRCRRQIRALPEHTGDVPVESD